MNDDDEGARTVAPFGESCGKVRTVDSNHRASEKDREASARASRKTRNACMNAIKVWNVDVPTSVNVVFRSADAVPEGRWPITEKAVKVIALTL